MSEPYVRYFNCTNCGVEHDSESSEPFDCCDFKLTEASPQQSRPVTDLNSEELANLEASPTCDCKQLYGYHASLCPVASPTKNLGYPDTGKIKEFIDELKASPTADEPPKTHPVTLARSVRKPNFCNCEQPYVISTARDVCQRCRKLDRHEHTLSVRRKNSPRLREIAREVEKLLAEKLRLESEGENEA